MKKKIIQSHRSVIFLNGILPDKKILKCINPSAKLISADGAYYKMEKAYDLIPDFIIGDGDSKTFEKKSSKSKVIKIPNQNLTDFEKCLLFAKEKNIVPSLILGINGGEIDHIFGNVLAMLKHFEKDSFFFLDTFENDNDQIGIKFGMPISKGKINIKLRKKSKISFLILSDVVLSTKGLKWELDNSHLKLDGTMPIRNENTSKEISIDIKNGKAMLVLDVSDFLQSLEISFDKT
jgi:thiamine pyrophosphokinase